MGLGKDVHRVLPTVAEKVQDVLDAIGPYLFPAYRAVGAADSGKEEAEVIVYLCGGCNGGTGVADVHLLLYGDCRRDAVDGFHIGLNHSAQKLAGVGGEALRKTALALGKKGVKRQGAFAAAGYAGNNHKAITRDFHGNVLEVVHTGLSDYYVTFRRHFPLCVKLSNIHIFHNMKKCCFYAGIFLHLLTKLY